MRHDVALCHQDFAGSILLLNQPLQSALEITETGRQPEAFAARDRGREPAQALRGRRQTAERRREPDKAAWTGRTAIIRHISIDRRTFVREF
jgi:hypothetical protein